MNKKIISDLLIRYILIIIFGLGNLYFFKLIFYPLTFFSSSILLNFFGSVKTFYSLGLILYNQSAIYLIDACVASSAYYLLFILNFSTRGIKKIKRIKLLLFSTFLFLVMNVIRIVFLSIISGDKYFDFVHLFFWYFVSIVFVVLVWFFSTKIFKIRETPIYSDFKFINSLRKNKR